MKFTAFGTARANVVGIIRCDRSAEVILGFRCAPGAKLVQMRTSVWDSGMPRTKPRPPAPALAQADGDPGS